jgi:hypothetical protein
MFEKYTKICSQLSSAKDLDHNVNENIKYGHTIISIVPTKMDHMDLSVVKEYKIIMLDCRYKD